jgi:hypothetical protein
LRGRCPRPCNPLLTKIHRHMPPPQFLIDTGVNQTQFLRSIDCAANSFGSFMKLKGKGGGAANKVYHNAYRFLEQYRILEGKVRIVNLIF